MEHQRASLQAALGRTVTVNGHTDLAVEGRKVSGNAQRRRRHAILFHGTFLLKADFHLMAEVLPPPSREPDYRAGRGHEDFLTTLNLSPQSIQSALMETWQVRDTIADWPRDSVATLVRDHYSREEWNLRH
jgi:lipoate-protein ligase A